MNILSPRPRDIGAFSVSRVLPAAGQRAVGPFVFFDHMGPATLAPGEGLAVRPHPHIGLATITFLFAGAILHRDSLGSHQVIRPGDVNWMTAGRGIVHSERSRPEDLAHEQPLHGLQTWLALPREDEDAAPAFTHVPAHELPVFDAGGVSGRVLAGDYGGLRAPLRVFAPTLYVALALEAGAAHPIESGGGARAERAVHAVEGRIEVDGVAIEPGTSAVLDPGRAATIRAATRALAVIYGGEPLDGERLLWWNFVATSRDRMEAAKAEWARYAPGGVPEGTARFPRVPDDAEWIPLPEE